MSMAERVSGSTRAGAVSRPSTIARRVRHIFHGLAIEAVETTYSANALSTRRAAELLISGGGS